MLSLQWQTTNEFNPVDPGSTVLLVSANDPGTGFPVTWVARDHDAAYASLAKLMTTWWAHYAPDRAPLPGEPEQAVQTYDDSSLGDHSSYCILRAEVQTGEYDPSWVLSTVDPGPRPRVRFALRRRLTKGHAQ